MKTRRIGVFALLVTSSFALGSASTALVLSRNAQASSKEESPYSAIAQLGRVLVEVENNYVEPVDRAKLVDGAIKGMVAELDPHSAYMPPTDFNLFQSETEGKFGGIGVEVDARTEQLIVIAPIEGSPAERAGIKSGDRIIAIDGTDITGTGLDKLVRKMRGAPGSKVKLVLRRDGVKDPIVLELTREIVKVPSVTYKLLDGGVGYVRIKQFQERTHDEVLVAAAKLRDQSKGALTGIMLDMRANPGGLVDESAEVADEFLTQGTIYTTRHRGKIIDDVKARRGGAFSELPAVVLVNEWTASASELVAGALQDHRRGLVVGAPTFGKGSVQAIIGLPGGAGLRLTTARYYTPGGHAIQADGVHPDVVIESSRVVSGGAFVIRERDLEGHLPAEGQPRPDDARDAGVLTAPPDGGTTDVIATDVRTMPSDPTRGTDFVMKVAYQVLRSTLVGRGPIVR